MRLSNKMLGLSNRWSLKQACIFALARMLASKGRAIKTEDGFVTADDRVCSGPATRGGREAMSWALIADAGRWPTVWPDGTRNKLFGHACGTEQATR